MANLGHVVKTIDCQIEEFLSGGKGLEQGNTVIRAVLNPQRSNLRVMHRMSWRKKKQVGEMSGLPLQRSWNKLVRT